MGRSLRNRPAPISTRIDWRACEARDCKERFPIGLTLHGIAYAIGNPDRRYCSDTCYQRIYAREQRRGRGGR